MQNTYKKIEMITRKFTWRSCEDKMPTATTITGIDTELMLDYQNNASFGLWMDWDKFTFPGNPHCIVNQYIFHCIDPDGKVMNRSNARSNNLITQIKESEKCAKFSMRKSTNNSFIAADFADFDSSDEGVYTITISGVMVLNNENKKMSQIASAAPFTRKI